MISLGTIGLSILALVGVVVMFGGMFAAFAAGQAASPTEDSDRTGKHGCLAFVAGLVVLVGSIAALVLR